MKSYKPSQIDQKLDCFAQILIRQNRTEDRIRTKRTLTTVSAIIPIYNRSRCIARAIQSVLAQSDPVDEIIVVDDCSDDGLDAVLDQFKNQIRTIRHTKNLGVSVSRNRGIQEATAEYVAFLDSDDLWQLDKISQQIEFMKKFDLNASCTNFDVVSSEDHNTPPVAAQRPYKNIFTLEDIVWGCYVSPGSTFVCKKELFSEVGYYDNNLSRYEDWDLLIRIIMKYEGKFGFLNEILSTIYYSGQYSPTYALSGLKMMADKHYNNIRSQGNNYALKFRSSISFNTASVYKQERRYLFMLYFLAKSIALHPRRNWPVKNILLKT